MKRFAYLALLFAGACSGGIGTGTGSVEMVTPSAQSATATPFEGEDGSGTKVMGWKIEFFEQAPGEDCFSADLNVVAKIGIYSNMAVGDGPQAILPQGEIQIVTMSPPTVLGQAAAVMSANEIGAIAGTLIIDDFHLAPDAKHADHIKGHFIVGGMSSNGDVSFTGSFDTDVCVEE
jgi:hypothetical protein